MSTRRGLISAMVTALVLGMVGATPSGGASDGAVVAKRYASCKALNRVYPHGVGRRGARDKKRH